MKIQIHSNSIDFTGRVRLLSNPNFVVVQGSAGASPSHFRGYPRCNRQVLECGDGACEVAAFRLQRALPNYTKVVVCTSGLWLRFASKFWRTFLLAIAACGLASPIQSQPADDVYNIDLPTALQLAGAQNLDIQIARQRLEEAESASQSARLQFFPWLSPGVSFIHHEGRIQETGGNVFDASRQSYAAGPTIAARVDLGDAIYKALAAKQRVTQAQEALKAQRQDAAFSAAIGYFDLSRFHANIEIARVALRISEDYQRQLHEAVGAGIAYKGDELRVQVQTERYAIALRQAQEQALTASSMLAKVLRLDATVTLVPRAVELVAVTLVPTDSPLKALVEQALAAHPELKQSQAGVSAAQSMRKGAKYGPLIPTVGAQAFIGGFGGGPGAGTENFGNSQDYSVFFGWRIGPGGLFDSSRIKAADARLAGAKLTEEKLRDEIIQQVVERRARVQSLADQLSTARSNLDTSTEALRMTENRKEVAVSAVLEVIQAQQDLVRARYDYLTTIAEYNKAQYALKKAIGEL